MNTETVTLIGIGVALLSTLVLLFRWLRQDIQAIRQDVDSRYRDLRQDIDSRHKDIQQNLAEIRQDVRSLHSRIDALYQALFIHKDPAA